MIVTIPGPTGGDDAPTINAAINQQSAAGGGDVVLTAGRYKVQSQIVVTNGVRLVGSGTTRFVVASPGSIAGGTIIEVNWGSGPGTSGNPATAAIILRSGASIDNLAFDYPSQTSNLTSPIEWGSTVLIGDVANGNLNQNITNCYFYKSYFAIDARSSLGIGNLLVSDCNGCALVCGLAISFVTDWVTIRDCHFNAGDVDPINPNNPLSTWTAQNGYAAYLGGNDWMALEGFKAWGYSAGCYIQAGAGYVGTGPYFLHGCDFDACWTGIILQGTFNQIVRAMGCNFAAFRHTDNLRGAAVAVAPGINTANGGLQLIGNYVFGPSNNLIWAAQSPQTFNNVIISNNICNVTPNGDTGVVIVGGDKIQIHANILHNFNNPLSLVSCTNTESDGNQT